MIFGWWPRWLLLQSLNIIWAKTVQVKHILDQGSAGVYFHAEYGLQLLKNTIVLDIIRPAVGWIIKKICRAQLRLPSLKKAHSAKHSFIHNLCIYPFASMFSTSSLFPPSRTLYVSQLLIICTRNWCFLSISFTFL